MDPQQSSGLHPGLFDDSLLGIGFYTVLEAGLIVSGNVGTGIVMARNPTNGVWSAPSAVGLSGIGWGLMGGANMKSILYLIYDYYTLDAMAGGDKNGMMLSSQAGASLGSWGRTAELSAIMSAKGRGTNIALAYSHGIFVGLSVEGAFSKARSRVNEKFYGRRVTAAEILFSGTNLLQSTTSSTKEDDTLLPELYSKLQRLCKGLPIYEPTVQERMKVESALRIVNKEESLSTLTTTKATAAKAAAASSLLREDSSGIDDDDDDDGLLSSPSQSSLLDNVVATAKCDRNADDDCNNNNDDNSPEGKQPTTVLLLPTTSQMETVLVKKKVVVTPVRAEHEHEHEEEEVRLDNGQDPTNYTQDDGTNDNDDEAIECYINNLQLSPSSTDNTSISTTMTSSSSSFSNVNKKQQQQQQQHQEPYITSHLR